MATLTKQLAEELKTKLQNARTMKKLVRTFLDYLDEEEKEIEKRDLELKNGTIICGYNDNLLAEKDQQLLDKESIIFEKEQTISELEMKLADAEIKLNRNSLLMTQHKEEIKKKELQVQELESEIERPRETHAKRLNDTSLRIKELQSLTSAKSQPRNTQIGQEQCESTVEATRGDQHKLEVTEDEVVYVCQTLVDEQEWSAIQLKKQLEAAENELKTNARQMQKLKNELRKTEKELLMSKQLANETMIREMKQVDLSDELKSILSNLTKDTAKIAEELHQKQYSLSHSYSTDRATASTKGVADTCKDSSDHLRRLRIIYPQLIERFDAKKLVGWMFAQHAIRLPELQSVLGCRTACEAAEGLLKIILNAQSDSIFECFLTALNQTNQQHVASWISFDGNVVTLYILHPSLKLLFSSVAGQSFTDDPVGFIEIFVGFGVDSEFRPTT